MAEMINLPGGGIYGGAAVFSMKGRDGAHYVVYCGERPGRKFGTHAFRVLPNGTSEWLELNPFTEGRSGVTVEADGAYITFPVNGDHTAARVKLPGYIPMDFDGQLPPPVDPQPVPQPTQPTGPCVDEGAREYTSAVKKELKGQIAKVEGRVAALEAHPANTNGITREQAWQLARDSVFDDIKTNPASGIRAEMVSIAKAAVPSVVNIDRAQLKEMVREVLKEIIAGL